MQPVTLGAYIFRTDDVDLQHVFPPKISSIKVLETPIISEVHAEFSMDERSTIKQITRLIKGKDYVEVEYVVDPIPIQDGIGKEIVSRFTTNIKSNGLFLTDSNGREFVERMRGDNKLYGCIEQDPVSIEPIAANYYPVNAAILVEDKDSSFTVLVDRSQGGSSLSDGSVELMIQRRLLHDDARGCAEPLNETDAGISPNPPFGNATRMGEGIVVKGVHRLMIGQGKSGAANARSRMDEIFSQHHVFVSSANRDVDVQFQRANFSGLESSLPKNIMLITFALRDDGAYLVRLGHQFGANESNEFSVPVEVDLSVLFPTKSITNYTEKTLSGNQNRIEWESKRLRWDTNKLSKDFVQAEAYSQSRQNGTTVTMKPLEIRTFEVEVV
jgi:alpha-mannosidase